MGQYFIGVNLDDRYWIDPQKMHDSAKALEIGSNYCGIMTGIVSMLGAGAWGNKRLALLGDYTTPDDKINNLNTTWGKAVSVGLSSEGISPYRVVKDSKAWVDISKLARHISYRTGRVGPSFSGVETRKLGLGLRHSVIFNETKREMLNPEKFGDFLDWEDFVVSPRGGILSALAGLLLTSNGRGSGDYSQHPLIGLWAGDNISIRDFSSTSGKDISIYVQPILTQNFNVKFKIADNGQWARYTHVPATGKSEWITSSGLI